MSRKAYYGRFPFPRAKRRAALAPSMVDLVNTAMENEAKKAVATEPKEEETGETVTPFLTVPVTDDFRIETTEPSLRSKPYFGLTDSAEEESSDRSTSTIGPSQVPMITQEPGYIEVDQGTYWKSGPESRESTASSPRTRYGCCRCISRSKRQWMKRETKPQSATKKMQRARSQSSTHARADLRFGVKMFAAGFSSSVATHDNKKARMTAVKFASKMFRAGFAPDNNEEEEE